MIKRILVPLDPSPYTETSIDVACDIAKRSEAELTGLVVLDIPGIEDSIGPIPVGGLYYAEKIELAKKVEASQRVEALLEKFKAKCDQEEVAHREAHMQGVPSTQILKESIFYDIVIIGLHTYFHFETSEKEGDSLEEILKESITPILGLPKKFSFLDNPNNKARVLIAFDGSPLSGRALQRFVQLITPNTMQLTLLNSSNDRERGAYLLDQAEIYLNTYGITEIKKEWTSEEIKKIIKHKYFSESDIFVVGAHSREGLFDFMVGSLTSYLVKQAVKPVFIGQ